MGKYFIIIVFQVFLFLTKAFSQNIDPSAVYLSNYTFSKNTDEIGFIRLNTAASKIKKITIKGENAKAFKITNDNKLVKKQMAEDLNNVDITLAVKTTAGNVEKSFRLVKDEFIRNKVIAHRGAWKNTGAPENSIAALKQAIALGCEGSEFDVHMSADSVLFINHDPHIQGVSIAKSKSEVLRQLKLTNGETLPTLEEYLVAGSGQNKTKLVLEIKSSELGKESSIARTRKVVQLVENLQLQAIVDYIAFDYDVCKEVMRLAPYAKVSYLNGDKAPAILAENKFFGLDYNIGVIQKNPGWTNEAKQNKLTVNVWTVNDKAIMENLLKQQVEFITTNEPELLLTLVSAK